MYERRRRSAPPRVVDAVMVGIAATVAVAGVLVWYLAAPLSFRLPLAVPLLLGVLQAAPLWWRRTRPVAVLAATLSVLVVAQAVGDLNAASFLGPHFAAYSAGVYARRPAVMLLGVMGMAGLLDAAVVAWLDSGPAGMVLIGPGGVAVVAAWGIGRYVRMRRDYLDAILAHARQLEQEQDEKAQQAILEERRRIARELHDQVAHHLGVVSLQTAAARRWLDRDAERTAAALEAAEQSARSALTTMPTILEALRADGTADDLAPQETLADIERLVSDVAAAGLSVALRVEGEPRPLGPAVELTAFRLVQEALTNTMKHAGPASADVTIRYGTDRLDVEVVDDGRGASADPGPGARQGLVGMRERVELLGGQLSVGPRAGGGYGVRAVLPTTAAVSA